MRTRTHRVLWSASLALTYACAAAPGPAQKPRDPSAELGNLRSRQTQQDQRIAELEARIALLEADARDKRSAGDAPVRNGETVRIGTEHALTSATPTVEAPARTIDDARDLDEARSAKRPKLRLYGRGEGTRGTADAAAALPTVPVVSETLPVAPLPEQRAASQQRAATAAASPAADSGDDGERELAGYRAGLRLLRERRFAEAAQAFGAFIADHPGHALESSAYYWRGEAHYARRDYAAARAEFEALIARFPRADKAADALLKLALCFRQLGAQDKAKEALRRLRADYPNSQAASSAAREGST